MSIASQLIGFGLRQVIGDSADAVVQVAEVVEQGIPAAAKVIKVVEQHFRDHSRTLPNALGRAHDRAWQSIAIALAGDGFLDRVRVFFSSGDNKGVREQVQLFLRDNAFTFEGTPDDFRQSCLDELKRLRKSGLLSVQGMSPTEIAQKAAIFSRHADQQGLVEDARKAVAGVANAIAEGYPNLARLIRRPTPAGPPLLAAAFCYFFRRQIETDVEFARGLLYDGQRQVFASQQDMLASLEHLTAAQAMAFEEVNRALVTLGTQFDALFEQLGRIEMEVVQTHEAVLDIQVELQRLGGLHLANADEVRSLLEQVLNHLGQIGMQRGELKPQHSFSIRGEDERQAVKALLGRFRGLPVEEQKKVPALLNGLGKLQLGAGDFAEAAHTFAEVIAVVPDPSGKAEASHNAYRVALEEKKYDVALEALQRASFLDGGRFAPFPLHRYEPRRILGAGGFGTAVMCLDRHFDEEVVVKTLHAADLDRGLEAVFREARVLRKLSHPAIIGVRDCEYANPTAKSRPYLVMDYFPGITLEDHVGQQGPLAVADLVVVAIQVARGMQAAHATGGVLHRDLKPANILVRKVGDGWQVKVIDFGLAMRKQVVKRSMAARSAGNTILSDSVAGTLKYAPPEQMGEVPGVKAGPYSDVYSFGKTCCYVLFLTTEPRRRQWEALPKELADLLEKCIEQELEHRHASFEKVLMALEVLDPTRKAAEEDAARRKLEQQERQAQDEARRQAEDKIRLEQEESARKQSEERVRQQQERKELQAANLVRLKESGRLTGWVEQRLQGWDHAAWDALIRELEGAGFYPLDHEQVGMLLEQIKRNGLFRNEGEAKLARLVREALERTRGTPIAEDTAAANELVRQHRIEKARADAIVRSERERWQKAQPKEPRPGEVTTINLGNGVAMKFAWCPPGTFLMGSPAAELERSDDETQHRVTLTQGYWLGTYPVTQAQWQAVMGSNPSNFKGNTLPVDSVSWDDCQELVKNLSQKTGKRFRLPTEAEWEYACRAGTTTPFHFGETISTDQANYDGNYTYGKGKKGADRQKTTPVDSFPANAWGLYDMHGNVFEWCQDWDGPYPSIDIKDPQGADNGTARVWRGGSWCNYPRICRSAFRYWYDPGCRVLLCLD